MRKKNGFSLVELMIVIAILGVIIAVSVPRFTGSTERMVENEARRIQSDLRLARALAITNSVNYILQVSPSTHEYKLYKGSIAPGNQVGETRVLNSNVTASGNDTFIFESLGNANASSGTSMTLTAGSHQYTITITIPTGRVSIALVS